MLDPEQPYSIPHDLRDLQIFKPVYFLIFFKNLFIKLRITQALELTNQKMISKLEDSTLYQNFIQHLGNRFQNHKEVKQDYLAMIVTISNFKNSF